MSAPGNRFTHIPPRLSGLADLAYNLWWSWHPEARILFKQVNRLAWKASIHNPVRLLRDTPQEFFLAAEKNEEVPAPGPYHHEPLPALHERHDRLVPGRDPITGP